MRARFFRGRDGAFGKLKFYQLRTFRTTGFALAIGRFSLWKFPCRSAMWCMIPGVEEVARTNERTATPPRGGSLEQAETRNRKRRRHPARILRKRSHADKIETLGMGKTVPAKFCPDIKGRSQLIACLAPNRRAIVSIKGPGR